MKMELIATASFGLEAVVRRELEALGCKIIKTEDGKVTFEGDERAIVRTNLWLRSADRVLLKMAEFEARTFEELFEQTKAIYWERLIPLDGRFTVTCSTVKSKLHNPPAIQSITKKAVVERMKIAYGFERFRETGADYTIKATLLKDRVTLTVDTSGPGLHKRGYRVKSVEAPIKETLAASLVKLTFWNRDRNLADPCCGSGTIAIEAAMIAANIAPGLNRAFASEGWKLIDGQLWKEERKRAFASIIPADEIKGRIFASDIDTEAVAAAKANAGEAGVEELIHITRSDISRFIGCGPGTVICTNLPYAVRIGSEEENRKIYRALKSFMKDDPSLSVYAISSDREMERHIGRKADRRRKLFNGNIETTYYQFYGEKPDENFGEKG